MFGEYGKKLSLSYIKLNCESVFGFAIEKEKITTK